MAPGHAVGSLIGKGVNMSEKSPRKDSAKKPSKSIKDKRRDKKEKVATKKGLGI